MKRIKTGKYRYRWHFIWFEKGDLEYHCNPDPSTPFDYSGRTLRDIKKYIDDWETAFEEGRTDGNFIIASDETIQMLDKQILGMLDELASMHNHLIPRLCQDYLTRKINHSFHL